MFESFVPNPLFFVNSYTTGFSPTVISNILKMTVQKKYKGSVSCEVGIPALRQVLFCLVVFMDDGRQDDAWESTTDVIYEDNHLLVVKNLLICLFKGILQMMRIFDSFKKYIKKANKPGNVYLGLVHRLDRPGV